MQALLSAKMQAMDPTSRSFYEEDGKDLDFYDFEPLPTLPEDEVSPSPLPEAHLPWRRGGGKEWSEHSSPAA